MSKVDLRPADPAPADPATAPVAAPGGAAAQTIRGGTVWLTGLSGAGKTTIALELAARARRAGRAVEVLDGDELREHLSPGLGFSRADRDAHVTRVGYLARLLARHGVLVFVPVIAPYAQTRAAVRTEHEGQGVPFVEVHVSTSVAECARRDVKGLYAAHAAGKLTHLTGVDDPYEAPTRPDAILDTTGQDLATSAAVLGVLLTERGLL